MVLVLEIRRNENRLGLHFAFVCSTIIISEVVLNLKFYKDTMSIPPTGTYKILSAVDSNALDADAGGGKKKCKLITWIYGGGSNQHFQVSPEGQGFRLTNAVREKKTGAMLVADDSDNGLFLQDFTGGENQQWVAIPVSADGSVLIRNVRTARCLRAMGHGKQVALVMEAPEDRSQWWNFIGV